MSKLIGFIENTEVLTLKGVKNIQDVEIGDVLVSQNNTLNTVTKIHKSSSTDNLYQVDIHLPFDNLNNNIKSIVTVGEQKFYTIIKEDKNPKWRTINELITVNNVFIGMPTYKHILYYSHNDPDDEEAKEWYLNHTIDRDYCILLGMFFINGKFIENNGIEFNLSSKLSILGNSRCGPNISDLEFVERFIGSQLEVFPTVCENTSDTLTKLVYMNQTVVDYFVDKLGPDNLIKTILSWTQNDIDNFITGLFTIKHDLSPYDPILYFNNHNTANTLCHLFNSHSIGCSVHETKFCNKHHKIIDKYNLDINDYKYHILLNHSFCFQKYQSNPNSPRFCKYNIKTIGHDDGKDSTFLNVEKIKKLSDETKYVYSLTLDNDNTYSVGGLVCKGF